MKISRYFKLCFPFIVIIFLTGCKPSMDTTISSPDGRIKANLQVDEIGNVFYKVLFDEQIVIEQSKLGIIREDADFSSKLSLISVSEPETITDTYTILNGKKKNCNYKGVKKTFHFKNKTDNKIDIIFQISDDGVGFRYCFPENSDSVMKITSELTSFAFPDSTSTWIQTRAASKTGWSQVNPSYEEHYSQNTLLSELPQNEPGWVFPALFHSAGVWITLTETFPDRNYCGSHLKRNDISNEFAIDFPEPSEGFPGGAVTPESNLPWYTPWRIITIGEDLATLAESTLGTDLAEPSKIMDNSYIKPGRASWSWVLLKDPSVNYKTQKEFIDYASDMSWEYCLVDGLWDTQIGWDKLKELSDYAAQKNVGLLVWYNSAGNWNTTYQTPKDKLLTKESRQAEFAHLKEIGIKGIKVDFFGGDGQSMLAYYIDILKDANEYQLMVNCHGATLPRGLERTYPNLVSTEAIRGLEYATFEQVSADQVPHKSTLLPYTRNIFDPMDFTPVCFTEYDNHKRITRNGAELAQAVIFLSGVQHYAETPAGMAKMPDYVKQAMRDIPVVWDETRFIDGFPGEYIVLARKSKNTWFIAGINAKAENVDLKLNIPFASGKRAEIITDGETSHSFIKQSLEFSEKGEVNISIKDYGGFFIQVNAD